MKATKKIVGAACALVAAVALSAGSTFAWFTSNGTVKANGLQIDVNTSNSFLIIGSSLSELRPASADDTTFTYLKEISLAPQEGTTVTKLLPSAYKDDATLAASGTDSIVDAGSWYTAQGTAPNDGTMDEATKEFLTSGNFSDYVVVADIWVSVAVGSNAVENVQLSVRPATGSSWSATNSAATNNDAISVVVLYQNVKYDGGTLGTWTKKDLDSSNSHMAATAIDMGKVTEEDYFQIKVMVYFDGNHGDVESVNAANLTGIKLDFVFTDGTESTPATPEVTE